MSDEIKLEGNAEIAQALQQLDVESSGVPVSPSQNVSDASDVPKMASFVIKLSGGTLSRKQAEYLLLGFVIVIVGVSVFLFYRASGGGQAKPNPEAIEQLRQFQAATNNR